MDGKQERRYEQEGKLQWFCNSHQHCGQHSRDQQTSDFLFILWLGIGELSKVTIIALGVFFPVAMNTYSGVKNVDTLLIKVAVSFNASWWLTMKSVVLPSALPVIFAGLRLAAGTSLLLLVAAEMIAAQEGIGALILHYGDLMITDRLMAGVIVLSLLGLIFNLGLQWLEHKIVPWKTQSK